MGKKITERYVWAVDTLDVQPSDEILEIGCGYGHSIPLICRKLTSGKLSAIDRSEKMVAAAKRSNQEFVDSGRASILHQDLLDGLLPKGYFDKIFLFNINAFWMDPKSELGEIRRLLKPNGSFFLFHQPPPGHDLEEFENAFRANLAKHNFLVHYDFKELGIPSLAIISTPNPR